MSRRKDNWGFPRWRGYGGDAEPAKVRLCDYHGCREPGDYPAPKSPLSDEKWWFCVDHVSEYNRSWNYFEGLSRSEADALAEDDLKVSNGFRRSEIYGWGGTADGGGMSEVERQALAVLEVARDAKPEEIKRQYRRLAKRYHPDTNADTEARDAFHRVRAAYELLKPRLGQKV